MENVATKLQCLVNQTAERGPTSDTAIEEEEVLPSPPPSSLKWKAFKPKAKGKEMLRTSTPKKTPSSAVEMEKDIEVSSSSDEETFIPAKKAKGNNS
ncbi:hypothetical protein ACJMK2_025668 [Sinanodonta woodiana]|uniref:Uncharacterized protein n=1 Tax=Sinanodonta woodiana TaxID=1069815 RepID=A0ABD3XJL7_SINWO